MEKPVGMSLLDFAREQQKNYDSEIVGATLDNVLEDLQDDDDAARAQKVDFIPMDSKWGWDIYRRSVLFLMFTAVHEIFPEAEVVAMFTAYRGLFCEVRHMTYGLDEASVERIEARMRGIIAENRPIVREELPKEEAVQLFKQSKQVEKANLIAALKRDHVSIYHCGDFYDYLYGPMLPETQHLDKFAMNFAVKGILLRTPDIRSHGKVPDLQPQPKLSHVLAEAKRWAAVLHCRYVPDLNRANRLGKIGEVIRISEALQEKRIAQIADYIAEHREELRFILIAGPSSSGKTSFAQRLRVQLCVTGLEPVSISLDDYFRNREDTPRNEKGEYDYESIGALDTELLNKDMVALLKGEQVILPRYNFLTGMREWQKDNPLVVSKDQPIIIEGIHGLNEKLSEKIPRNRKLKIYVSALTQLNIDAHNRIATTDARLIRRLVRDYQFRGSHALKTLKMWPEVRAGEEKNIFPYQEEADVMFNSALIYELGVLKKYAEPILQNVPVEVPEHIEAKRLLDILQYFDNITDEYQVPNNSILREFIGKSVFFT